MKTLKELVKYTLIESIKVPKELADTQRNIIDKKKKEDGTSGPDNEGAKTLRTESTDDDYSEKKDNSYKQERPVGSRQIKGKSYQAKDADEDEPAEPKVSSGRGRPAGALGAAKKAASGVSDDQGKSLQDILLGKTLPKVKSALIVKGKAQSASPEKDD